MSALAERQSVTKTRITPAPCKAATRLWPGAKSVIVEPCSANGAQRRFGIPSQAVEKSRSRTVGSSSATQFCVVHCRSGALVGGCGSIARFASSLAAAEAISLADSAMSAGHRKAAHANCELFNPYIRVQDSVRASHSALRKALREGPAMPRPRRWRHRWRRCRDERSSTKTAQKLSEKSGHFHLRRLFARWVQDRAGHGIDPGQMIVDGLHARRVLRRDHNGLALSFVRNHSPELDYAIPYEHIDQGNRRPGLACEFRQNAVADGLITGRSRPDVARHAGKRMDQVGAADDPNHLLVAHHGQALDLMLLHQPHDLIERRVLGGCERIGRHDLADLAAMGASIFVGQPARPDEVLEPARPPALRSGFRPPEEIALGHNSDESAFRVDHG